MPMAINTRLTTPIHNAATKAEGGEARVFHEHYREQWSSPALLSTHRHYGVDIRFILFKKVSRVARCKESCLLTQRRKAE